MTRLFGRTSAAPPPRDATLARYEEGPVIGEGGMSVLRSARQRELGREIAVKRLRPELRGQAALRERLLNEARLTGALEHPNILPIHDVGVDADGEPFVVLRRIDGQAWSSLMADRDAVAHLFGQRDLLEWNLRVLMQVCNAAHYAHSRGVIHLDIKPDNVMLGAFGEVYLLDWGIAVELDPDAAPADERSTQPIGTPAYMAPEMVHGLAGGLSPQTDVYLLGATLYEILAGRAPHCGGTITEALAQIVVAEPPVPTGAPAELLAIVERAMRRAPGERHADAEQLRLAIQSFLEHRDSQRLSDDAAIRLEQLRQVLASPGAERERIYALLGVCRFGFKGALSTWPDNATARRGLRDALSQVAQFELERGQPHAAAALVAECQDIDDALRSRIDAALASSLDRDARLTAIARDSDRALGRGARLRLASALALAWVLGPLGLVFLAPIEVRESHAFMFTASSLLVVFLAGVGLAARGALRQTALNRHVFGAFVLLAVGQLALVAGSALGALSPVTTITQGFFLWFAVATMLTITADRRLVPTAAACLVAYLAVSARPDARDVLISAVGAAFWLNSALIWRFPDWLAAAEGLHDA